MSKRNKKNEKLFTYNPSEEDIKKFEEPITKLVERIIQLEQLGGYTVYENGKMKIKFDNKKENDCER